MGICSLMNAVHVGGVVPPMIELMAEQEAPVET